MFRFSGKFMALSMVHNVQIDAHLTSSLYKFLIGAPLTIRDMEQLDEEVARSIKKILDDAVEPLMLDFTIGAEVDGRPVSVELKPGGGEIAVCEENKHEYVQLCLNYYFRTYAAVQISAFLEGFFELIPQEKLAMFTADELDLVICGIPEIDVEDLQKNCHVIEPYTRKHQVVRTFFNILRNWKSDDLAKLLQFVTGSSQVPAGGFATLMEQGRPFAIAPGGNADRLPAAHVCTNQLDLPSYDSEEIMNQKLLCAVRNCSGFGKA
jgi:E3 ubiquitin-protein ligase NEDD4